MGLPHKQFVPSTYKWTLQNRPGSNEKWGKIHEKLVQSWCKVGAVLVQSWGVVQCWCSLGAVSKGFGAMLVQSLKLHQDCAKTAPTLHQLCTSFFFKKLKNLKGFPQVNSQVDFSSINCKSKFLRKISQVWIAQVDMSGVNSQLHVSNMNCISNFSSKLSSRFLKYQLQK